jgi:hypothetical protein
MAGGGQRSSSRTVKCRFLQLMHDMLRNYTSWGAPRLQVGRRSLILGPYRCFLVPLEPGVDFTVVTSAVLGTYCFQATISRHFLCEPKHGQAFTHLLPFWPTFTVSWVAYVVISAEAQEKERGFHSTDVFHLRRILQLLCLLTFKTLFTNDFLF